jgi:AcrR family transcriptional regulator
MAISSTERREELLGAALVVIRRDGPSASMDAMAAEAGITKPILYRHFGDRDGLIAAVANRFADELVVRLTDALGEPGEPRMRIGAAVESYVGFIEEDPGLYGFLTQRAQVSSLVESGVIERVAVVLEAAISETIEATGLPPRSTETWAYGVVGMMHLAGAHWASTPGQPREALIADLVSLVSDGLLGATAADFAPDPAASPALRRPR